VAISSKTSVILFPYVIPAILCHSRESGNLSYFFVFVGVEFIRPVFIAGLMNQTPTVFYFVVTQCIVPLHYYFVCFLGYNHNIDCLTDFNIATREASINYIGRHSWIPAFAGMTEKECE